MKACWGGTRGPWGGPKDLWEGPQDSREGPQDPLSNSRPLSGCSSGGAHCDIDENGCLVANDDGSRDGGAWCDPGLGSGSPRGGRGPGSPLPSLGLGRGEERDESWGGFRNHCEDVGRPVDNPDVGGALLGGGETLVAGCLRSKLSVITWNCATLFGAAPRTHEQRRRHAAKVDRVVSFSCRHDAVMLQEVHGNEQDIGELASRIPRHSILGSLCRGVS